MHFMETTTYQMPPLSEVANHHPLPSGWERCIHPNGDAYYYNAGLHLITPEDICDPSMLHFVLDARADHLQCLQGDNSILRLPDDWELTLTDVTEVAAVIGMFSRKLGHAYEWTEERGLEIKASPEYFWSHVAEYPSHHEELAPGTEEAFIQALIRAKASVADGVTFPFTEDQIDQIFDRYSHLKVLRDQGKTVTPALGWLIGAVMPLDAVERACTDEDLERMMGQMQF